MDLFRTKRLSVRPFKLEDGSDCEEFLSDPEVMKYIGDGNFDFSITSAQKMVQWFIQSSDSAGEIGTWAIVSLSDKKVIGNYHLSVCNAVDKVEFGLSLSKKYWRQGLGTELCEGLLQYGRKTIGYDAVGITHSENVASKRLLKRLNFKFDRELELYGVAQELYVRS
mgnify:CR=1 FL=1